MPRGEGMGPRLLLTAVVSISVLYSAVIPWFLASLRFNILFLLYYF